MSSNNNFSFPLSPLSHGDLPSIETPSDLENPSDLATLATNTTSHDPDDDHRNCEDDENRRRQQQQREQSCCSPLSTLSSPQSSFETNEAHYGVKYSWSGGTLSTIGADGIGIGIGIGIGSIGQQQQSSSSSQLIVTKSNEHDEMGHEVQVASIPSGGNVSSGNGNSSGSNNHGGNSNGNSNGNIGGNNANDTRDSTRAVVAREVTHGSTPRAGGGGGDGGCTTPDTTCGMMMMFEATPKAGTSSGRVVGRFEEEESPGGKQRRKTRRSEGNHHGDDDDGHRHHHHHGGRRTSRTSGSGGKRSSSSTGRRFHRDESPSPGGARRGKNDATRLASGGTSSRPRRGPFDVFDDTPKAGSANRKSTGGITSRRRERSRNQRRASADAAGVVVGVVATKDGASDNDVHRGAGGGMLRGSTPKASGGTSSGGTSSGASSSRGMCDDTPKASGTSSSSSSSGRQLRNDSNNNNERNEKRRKNRTTIDVTDDDNNNNNNNNTNQNENENENENDNPDDETNENEKKNLPTPSWDIDQTFSFRRSRCGDDKLSTSSHHHHHHHRHHPKHPKHAKQHHHHGPKRSQSSFSGIWDFMHTIGLSRSESIVAENNNVREEDYEQRNRESHDRPPSSRHPHMTESNENDLFAMEVGLMFSADEGDTINDPSTLYSQNFSASFTIESEMSAHHPPAYDLAKYLRYRRENGTMPNDDDVDGIDIIDVDAVIAANRYSDDSTLCTMGQSTVRDDHGNKVPENAKMILGYDNVAKHRKKMANNNSNNNNATTTTSSKKRRNQANQAFPTVNNADGGAPHSPEEMERRLRELAGRINADWRGSAFMPPALARRLRDFQFAREKRRRKYGRAKPWGILGLYDHLSGVKIDVEWAEDAAWRRTHRQPYLTWCDFEATKNEGFNRPFFTFLTVSSCTAMMFTSIFVNGWKFEPLSVNPMVGPSAETLLTLGAKDSYLIVMQQEIWRLVSPMVLHAGLIHFFLNMFALWFVGKAIEQVHGFFPAMVQFVVPAIGGTILSAIFLPEYITVGASGGIFGLIGACTADIAMNWNLLFNEFVNERGARLSHARVLLVLLLDIVLNCLIGLTPFVDNFTHLGGMIYGFLCGLSTIQLVSPRFFGDDRRCFHNCKLFFFRSFGLLVCMSGIIASSIFLFSGDGDTNPCPSCTYMSCISFPPWTGDNEKWWYCDDCARASAEGTLDTTTGKFTELNISCPSGSNQIVGVDESWPQNEIGLEEILPSLCREHCLL